MFHRHGFSLVEAVIALGIAAFAITTILAIMPVGLTTLRSAMDHNLEARMVRKIAADLRMTPFHAIASGRLYFDFEGDEVADAARARYEVRYQPAPPAGNAPPFPGAPASIGNDFLVIGVEIHRVATGAGEGPAASPIAVFPVAVSRNEASPPQQPETED